VAQGTLSRSCAEREDLSAGTWVVQGVTGGGAAGSPARVPGRLPRRATTSRLIPTPLPSPVTTFLREHIASIEQLEVLLLLRSERRPWHPTELSSMLRTSPDSVVRRLDALERDGLVSRRDGGFRFDAGPLAKAVDALASCYPTHRVAVIETIFSAEPS
jgi:hypothetical protein